MNAHTDENPFCYFHSNEVVVGICALCLKEKLLVLATKHGHRKQLTFRSLKRKPAIFPLPKLFSLSTFLQLLEPRQPAKKGNDVYDDDSSIASLEDSFISMKIEENGNTSWDSTNIRASVRTGSTGISCKGVQRSIVEHCKRSVALRWRKRIEQLLQLARWKRYSNEAKTCNAGIVSKLEGLKIKGGLMRSLTKRRKTTS